ncbi:hypothetical protein SDC9_112259 [bioreactor metagenome]|uniref:Uncharacterized protein n=1 Tax=bioreactor metagenome TaxID=1076179 RepID=A0A645BU94_9ZZZZ
MYQRLGEYQGERASLPFLALQVHLGSILLHDMLYQRQSKTGLHCHPFIPDDTELLKNMLLAGFGNTRPCITDGNEQPPLFSNLSPDPD